MLIDSLPELPRYSRRKALALLGGFAGGISVFGCALRGETKPVPPAPKAPTQLVEPDPVVAQPTQPADPTTSPRTEPIPEPKREPTATATKEPTVTIKPPEAESPFPVYGVFEGEYRVGNQVSYVVATTPLDEKVGAVVTYLDGLEECSTGRMNYGTGLIGVDRENLLRPGFKRGRFGDSFDATYNPQQQSLVGRLVIPPHPEIKTCDAQIRPFEARLVGYGPDSFLDAYVRSYRKAGLEISLTTAIARERVESRVGKLPPPAIK